METAILNSMCRCCASEGVYKDVKTSYTWMGEEEVYADMLREIFDISLSTAEHGEDGGICEVCITQLRNAANFKKQVLHTEEQFKKHVNHKLFKPSIVKVEALPEDDNDSDDNNVSAEEGFSGPEFEVPIKTETEEQKPKKRAAAAKATTSRAKKAKNDNGESSTKRPPEESTLKVSIAVKTEEITADDTNVSSTSKQTALVPVKRQEIWKHRTNITEILLSSNATPIRRYEDMGYMCCYCKDQYPDPADLKKHTLESHQDVRKACFMKLGMEALVVRLDITSLRCKICDASIDTLEKLVEHLKSDHQIGIYTDIKSHMTPFKFITETLQCCICTNTFGKFKLLLEHMNLHYRNYICKQCDAGFTTICSLRNHMHVHENGNFKCEYCSTIFETASKKKAHERAKHVPKLDLYKCGYCTETFHEYRFKEAHLVSVHGLKIPTSKCQACNKVFNNRQALRIHVKRDHLLERRHKCPECDMSFFKSRDLKQHIIKHTKLRTHKCTVCSKAFGRAYTLNEHLKIHNNIRRFKCEHCAQAFVQKCSWRGHMKSKHGEIV